MKNGSRFAKMEDLIVRDEKLLFTTVSYFMILIVFLNLSFHFSSLTGAIASVVYLLINGTFLGHGFFEKEDIFLRFMMGNLLLVTSLALIAWAVMIIYNLDVASSTLVLCIVAAQASLINKWKKPRNVIP